MTPTGPTGPGLHLGAALNQLLKDREGNFSGRGWAIMVVGGTLLVFGGFFLIAVLLQG